MHRLFLSLQEQVRFLKIQIEGNILKKAKVSAIILHLYKVYVMLTSYNDIGGLKYNTVKCEAGKLLLHKIEI
jgi:hypothetical protein